MPETRVVFYTDGNACPVLEWLERLPTRVQAKAYVRIERPAEMEIAHALDCMRIFEGDPDKHTYEEVER